MRHIATFGVLCQQCDYEILGGTKTQAQKWLTRHANTHPGHWVSLMRRSALDNSQEEISRMKAWWPSDTHPSPASRDRYGSEYWWRSEQEEQEKQ